MTEYIVNMSASNEATGFLNRLRRLRGVHRIDVVKHRARRSDRQNAWYWPCFVHEFGEYLRNQGENVTDEDCHEMLKFKFLQRSMPIPFDSDSAFSKDLAVIAKPLQYTASTTALSIDEFNDYLDHCAHWLEDMFGIVIPEPEAYHVKD